MRIKYKRYKKYKTYEKQKFKYGRNFKFIFILLLIIIYYYYNFTDKNIINNNNWIKKNTTEILNNYLSIFKGYNIKSLIEDTERLKQYLNLKILIKEENSPLNLETKEKLRQELSSITNKSFSLLKSVFISHKVNFGNQIIFFNNLIYYCEILGIRNIYLNSKINWYIKNDIKTDKIHISFISPKNIKCQSSEFLCVRIRNFFHPTIIKSERRSMLLKEEIKRNLPQIKTNVKDLYIYIRSGDSFYRGGNHYPQAPYCFYQKIITNFKFNDIYIISQDDKSPVIKKLLSDYPNIKYTLSSMEIDFSTLSNAYNLVNAVSSFSQTAISFNDNLINIFEYNLYPLLKAILHFHYDIDKYDRIFNVYRMKPPDEYLIKSYDWENTDEQRQLLFGDFCKNDFKKTKNIKRIFE